MRVDEYEKDLRILGYRLKGTIDPKTLIVEAREVCSPVLVQLFDAENMAGERHLFFGTLNALKTFSQGRGLAQSLDIEILLCVSAQKQIGEAIRKVGIRPATSQLAAVLVGDDEAMLEKATKGLESSIPGLRDQSILNTMDHEKLTNLSKLYDISPAELESLSGISKEEAIQWLIIEQTAILDVKR